MEIERDQELQFVRHVLGEFEALIEENDSIANYHLDYVLKAKRIMDHHIVNNLIEAVK